MKNPAFLLALMLGAEVHAAAAEYTYSCWLNGWRKNSSDLSADVFGVEKHKLQIIARRLWLAACQSLVLGFDADLLLTRKSLIAPRSAESVRGANRDFEARQPQFIALTKHHPAVDLGASSARTIVRTLEHGGVTLDEMNRFRNGSAHIRGNLRQSNLKQR